MAERCPECGKFRRTWVLAVQTEWAAMTEGPVYICIECAQKENSRG